MKEILKLEAGELKARVGSREALLSVIDDWTYDYPVDVKIQAASSTLDYKAVFWIWMRAFAKSFTERGRDTKPEEMHDIFCHTFLGILPERTIGKTVIPPTMRTITYPQDLTRPEFFHFMRQIEEKAQSWGLQIPDYNSMFDEDKAREAG